MKIKLENIAKVIEADINMDGISIIAGNNNVGKSTILKSMYIAINLFRNVNEKIMSEQKNSLRSIIMRFEDYFDAKGYDFLPKDFLETFYINISEKISFLMESDDRFSEIKRCFNESLEEYSAFVGKDDFIYSDEFLRPLYDSINDVFKRTKEALLKYIGDMYIKSTFNSQINFATDISSARISVFNLNGNNFIKIVDNKIESLSYNSINEADAIYLPAVNILDMIDGGRKFRRRIYSPEGNLSVFLNANPNRDGTFEEYNEIEENILIIKEIIDEVVNGNLSVNKLGVITYDDNDLDVSISMENVASGIKNFLIIKKLVENGFLKKNGVLLIDEPETNLHPEWHLKFAEILVLMHKHMGVVSVVNSHSPYFIRALEVKMADYGIKEKGHYYLMKEKEKHRYIAEDVTKETDKIYKTLYKPLEYL